MLYTAPAIISIVRAFQQSFPTIAWLVVLWVLFTIGRPVERIASAWRQWKADTALNAELPSVGVIDRVDYPNIIRIRLNPGGTWKPRTLHVAAMPDGDQQFVLSLFAQVQGTDVIGTGLCVAGVGEKLPLPTGHVCVLHDEARTAGLIEALSGAKDADLIGFTVENSTIGMLRFEIAASTDLAEGNVIELRVVSLPPTINSSRLPMNSCGRDGRSRVASPCASIEIRSNFGGCFWRIFHTSAK